MKAYVGDLTAWWKLARGAVSAWSDDYAPSMGAALAYYSVFSMAPLLLIVISIAGLVFGEDAARGEVLSQLRELMGAAPARTIEGLLTTVSQPAKGIPSAAISAVLLLVGATTVFGELQDALDRIWRVPARKRSSGLWRLLRSRMLSFGMILAFAFLLIISLLISAAITALGRWWGHGLAGWAVLLHLINLCVDFALTTAVFGMIYKIMPRAAVKWHDVWLGAITTSALFNLGQFLIGLYIGQSGVATTYGAAASLVIIFVWVYYSAQIFLLGAEFTWVYARTYGSRRGDDAGPTAPERRHAA